jgi:hypothetical protein
MSGRSTHSDLANPMFEAAGSAYDWRSHVGKYAQQVWKSLDGEQRAAIALDAEDIATSRDWDD